MTEVTICNLALAHLGEDATVASIDPPEGSAQAGHCARFFPVARDMLLEMHEWGFATRRETLAELENSEVTSYQYTYAMPNQCLRVIAVLPPSALDDTSAPPSDTNVFGNPALPNAVYQPLDYATEILSDGTKVIYTNTPEATVRFIERVTDPAKWSPLFSTALSYILASFLAGPVLKGEVGRKTAQDMFKMASSLLSSATVSDASQKKSRPTHAVPWMQDR